MTKKREEEKPNPVEDAVRQVIYHTPIKAKAGNYLYSALELMLPVPGGSKVVVLRRKVKLKNAVEGANEKYGSVRVFSNLISFTLKAADEFSEEIYADDDEEFNRIIGKSSFKLDRKRLKTVTDMRDILATKGLITYIDLRTSEEPEEANA
jgi:hypothetical protein